MNSLFAKAKRQAKKAHTKGKQKITNTFNAKVLKIDPSERYQKNQKRYQELMTGHKELVNEWKTYQDTANAHLESSFKLQYLMLKFAKVNTSFGREEFEAFQSIRASIIQLRKKFYEKTTPPFLASLHGMASSGKNNLASLRTSKNTAKAAMLEQNRLKGKMVNITNKDDSVTNLGKLRQASLEWQTAAAFYKQAELGFEKDMNDFEADKARGLLGNVALYMQELLAEYRDGYSVLAPMEDWIVRDLPDHILSLEAENLLFRKERDENDRRLQSMTQVKTNMMEPADFEKMILGFREPDQPVWLEGEKLIMEVDRVVNVSSEQLHTAGVFYLTDYRVLFCPYPKRLLDDEDDEDASRPVTEMPLCGVARAENIGGPWSLLTLWCKDLRNLVFSFRHSQVEATNVYETLGHFIWQDGQVFAYKHRPSSITDPGWLLYCAKNEYTRLGITTSHPKWRISDINNRFRLCSSYPRALVVPKLLSDGVLWEVARFRSKKRVPIMVWRAPNDLCIFRCSQPKVGITKARSPADEQLLRAIGTNAKLTSLSPISSSKVSKTSRRVTQEDLEDIEAFDIDQLADQSSIGASSRSSAQRQRLESSFMKPAAIPQRLTAPRTGSQAQKDGAFDLAILDCRPHKNALGNVAKGGGWELADNYHNCCVTFLDIENIHVVRNSFRQLGNAFLLLTTTAFRVDVQLPKMSSPHAMTLEQKRKFVEDTEQYLAASSTHQRYAQIKEDLCKGERVKWFRHLASVLNGAQAVVTHVTKKNMSVLVHCSDGWDRTPQVTALAQLLMDPYHRTLRGFAALIEKEFCSFGHKFAQRLGHGKQRGNYHETQRSPIFTQFIDCVFQVLKRFPTEFEFNSLFLADLVDHSLSCRFGTFLMNNDRERRSVELERKTTSLWSFVFSHHVQPFYTSTQYKPSCRPDQLGYGLHSLQLDRPWSAERLHLFLPYYIRWDPMTANPLSLTCVQLDPSATVTRGRRGRAPCLPDTTTAAAAAAASVTDAGAADAADAGPDGGAESVSSAGSLSLPQNPAAELSVSKEFYDSSEEEDNVFFATARAHEGTRPRRERGDNLPPVHDYSSDEDGVSI